MPRFRCPTVAPNLGKRARPCDHVAVRTALLALAGSGCITALHVTAPATVADRELAPPFTLPAQDGAPVSLAGALAGGPVALVFYRGYW
jgi:hypothetical protein